MATNQSNNLIALNDLDKTILAREKTVKDSALQLEQAQKSFSLKSKQLGVVLSDLAGATGRHQDEERKLREEEVKIVERRKQLTSLGGAKSAKLVERELDIAKRIMETLEQNVIAAMEQMETLSKKKETLQSEVEILESTLSKKRNEVTEQAELLQKELEGLRSSRAGLLEKLDERLQSLYKRVEKRYRGEAVAVAENGSCRSCFRALPAQTFNQVIAGYNLIQCPGCSRILVYVAPSEDAGDVAAL